MVKCKFKCESKTQRVDGITIRMIPVTHGSPENEKFFKYTPWGVLEIGTINETAASQIEVDKEYYINISDQKIPDIDNLEKRLVDANNINRALQLIRNNYEQKYGMRMFTNGVEEKLEDSSNSQNNPPL